MKRLMWLGPILLLAGCAQPAAEPVKPAVDLAKEAATIRSADDAWKAAAKAKDVAKTVSYWADDATLIVPGFPAVVGKAAIQKFVEDSFKDKNFAIDWTADKIEVAESGDLAYETATETVTVTQGKKVVTMKQFGTVVWKKQADGSWKSIIDQGTDVSAPASPAKR